MRDTDQGEDHPMIFDKMARNATLADYNCRIGRVWDRLAESTDGHDRAKLLMDAASLEREISEAYRAGGSEPLPDEPGRDMAGSAAMTAQLLDALADVEFVAAGSLTRRHATGTAFEAAGGAVLDRMAATTDLTARAELLEELYDAVVDVVGDQAAEVLYGLPYAPGMTGWRHEESLPSTVSLRSFAKVVRILWRTRKAA